MSSSIIKRFICDSAHRAMIAILNTLWYGLLYVMAPKSINVWEHGERLGGAGWKCKYCNLTKSGGGVTRLKEHLTGKPAEPQPIWFGEESSLRRSPNKSISKNS